MNEQDEPKETGRIEYSGKDWPYTISSGFVQGTTNELRRAGIRIHNLSAMARMLYIYLRSYVGPNCDAPYPSLYRISTDLDINQSTVKKYRRELENAGYLVRKQRRDGEGWTTNSYLLMDVEIPTLPVKISPAGICPTGKKLPTAKSPTKEYHIEGEAPTSKQREGDTSNKTAPSGGRAGDAADPTPSANDNPRRTPKEKAKAFIENYHQWSEAAGYRTTVSVIDKDALREFFQDNPRTTVRELTAILVACFLAKPKVDDPDEEEPDTREPFWFCLKKGRRIGTFVRFLTNIQDELSWKGTDDQIEGILEKGAQKFQRKAK